MPEVLQTVAHTFIQHHYSPYHTTPVKTPYDDVVEILEDPEKGAKVLKFLTETCLPTMRSDAKRQCLGKVKIYGVDFEFDLEENVQLQLKLRAGQKVLIEWEGQNFAEISDEVAKTTLLYARQQKKHEVADVHPSPYEANREYSRSIKQTSPITQPSSAKKREAFTPVTGGKAQSSLSAKEPKLSHGTQLVKKDLKIKALRERLQALTKEHLGLGTYQMRFHTRDIDKLGKGQRQPINIKRDVAILTQKLLPPEYANLPGAKQLKKDESLSHMLDAIDKRIRALGEDIENQMRPGLTIGVSPKVHYCNYVELEERTQLYRTINSVTSYLIDLTRFEDILKRALPHREDHLLTEMFNKFVGIFRKKTTSSNAPYRSYLNSGGHFPDLYVSTRDG